jgi:hypothetical protein
MIPIPDPIRWAVALPRYALVLLGASAVLIGAIARSDTSILIGIAAYILAIWLRLEST